VSAEVAQHLFAEGRACTQNLGAFAVKGEREAVGLVEILTSDAAALREAKAASREALAHALAHYTDAALVEALTIVRKIAEAAPGDGAPHWRLARMQHELASVALRAPTASCASTTRGPRLRVEDQHPHVVDQVRPHGGSEASGSNKPG
jgi:hypothetical protein